MIEKISPHRVGFTQQEPISILERFYHNLPAWPFCMAGLNQPSYQLSKERAIRLPYIQLNRSRRAYLCLDLDRPNALHAHEEIGMPVPTITLVNPVNGHAHTFYELGSPVAFTGRARERPQKYFMAVQKAFTLVLQADRSFNDYMVKNPFHDTGSGGKWERILNCVTYDLRTLASYVDLKKNQNGFRKKSRLHNLKSAILQGQRNVTVFDIVRHYAYQEVSNHTKFETFHHVLRKFSLFLNQQNCKPPLSRSEIEYVIGRVSDWAWNNKTYLTQHLPKKKGVMGLDPISSDLNLSERQAEIKRREENGARYTHSRRKQRTEKAIVLAIEQLKIERKNITKSAVARRSGVRRETISRNYKYLFDAENL